MGLSILFVTLLPFLFWLLLLVVHSPRASTLIKSEPVPDGTSLNSSKLMHLVGEVITGPPVARSGRGGAYLSVSWMDNGKEGKLPKLSAVPLFRGWPSLATNSNNLQSWMNRIDDSCNADQWAELTADDDRRIRLYSALSKDGIVVYATPCYKGEARFDIVEIRENSSTFYGQLLLFCSSSVASFALVRIATKCSNKEAATCLSGSFRLLHRSNKPVLKLIPASAIRLDRLPPIIAPDFSFGDDSAVLSQPCGRVLRAAFQDAAATLF